MSIDATICPVCGRPPVVQCRCPKSDSWCENEHKWHICLKHNKIVMGFSDHSKSTFDCSCPEEEKRDAI